MKTEELRSPFKWVSLFRITAITVIIGIGIYFFPTLYFSPLPLWIIIGLTYLLTFLYWRCFKKGKLLIFILWVSVILDIFIVTALIHYSGGIESEFAFLYFLPIVSASIFFFLKGGTLMATLSLSAYVSILVLELRKIIAPVFPLPPTLDIWTLYTKLYLQATFFYLIAVTSGYLAERLRQKEKALEQVKLDTSTILHSIKSGLLAINPSGTILYKNRLVDKILDTQVKENINQLPAPIKEQLSKLLNKEGFREFTLSSKIIGTHTSKLRDTKGKDRGVVIVLDDLTDSIITERLATIGKFSGDLAHEVRNPVAAIQGSCELLNEGVNKDEREKLTTNILTHTTRLNNIVANFLSFTKSPPLNLQPTNIASLINEAARLATMEVKNNQIQIDISGDDELSLKLDREQMKTAFLNLILNSIQSMNEGIPEIHPHQKLHINITREGKYLLLTEPKNTEPDEIVITFTDTGKGIPESQIPQIFTPFYTTKKGGAGLGLSIVSKIINAHNGRIEVKSKIGEGTCFAIHLPYQNDRLKNKTE